VDKLQFNTLATLRFSGVSSSVVETAELSGGAMMIDISLAQNDVDSFKWGGPWSDFTLKFSDKPGMIFDSLSVVSWSCLQKIVEGEQRKSRERPAGTSRA